MQITRRQFIKYVSAAGAALGLSEAQIFKLTEAVAKVGGGPDVLWLQGQPCNGCTVATAQLLHGVTPDNSTVLGTTVGSNVIVDSYSQPVEDYLDGTYNATVNSLAGVDLTHVGHGSNGTKQADIADVLIDVIDLNFHQTLMSAAGYQATDGLWASGGQSGYILVVEGSIPANAGADTYVGEHACQVGTRTGNTGVTMADAVLNLASGAAAIVAVGTCASFGGWPASRNKKWEAHEKMQPVAHPEKYRRSGALSVEQYLSQIGIEFGLTGNNKPIINLPGCPMRAEELYLTVAAAIANFSNLAAIVPALDDYHRPTELFTVALYDKPIHNRCLNKNDFLNGRFATQWGASASGSHNGGCLAKLGCKGPSAWRSCQRRSGSGAVGTWETINVVGSSTVFPGTSCINAGAACMACGEKGYPDRFSHPLVTYTAYGTRIF